MRLQLPQDDLDLIIDAHANVALVMTRNSYAAEAHALLSGLAQVATTPYQVTEGVTNVQPRPTTALAFAAAEAQASGQQDLAAFALVHWAATVGYFRTQFRE
jgi:hypothetical protein